VDNGFFVVDDCLPFAAVGLGSRFTSVQRTVVVSSEYYRYRVRRWAWHCSAYLEVSPSSFLLNPRGGLGAAEGILRGRDSFQSPDLGLFKRDRSPHCRSLRCPAASMHWPGLWACLPSLSVQDVQRHSGRTLPCSARRRLIVLVRLSYCPFREDCGRSKRLAGGGTGPSIFDVQGSCLPP
jgi:hypothetical protein